MFNSVDEMYAAVGYGSISLKQVMVKLITSNKALSDRIKTHSTVRKSAPTKKENAVIVKGMEDLLVRFSKCCSPVPGDEIVGYISRGRGVCIHRADCPALKSLEPERLAPAEWVNTDNKASFPVSLEIIAENKGDIFAEITKVIASEGLPLVAINARKDRKGNAVAQITVEISNHDQCNQLIQKLKSLSAVINAYRTHG